MTANLEIYDDRDPTGLGRVLYKLVLVYQKEEKGREKEEVEKIYFIEEWGNYHSDYDLYRNFINRKEDQKYGKETVHEYCKRLVEFILCQNKSLHDRYYGECDGYKTEIYQDDFETVVNIKEESLM